MIADCMAYLQGILKLLGLKEYSQAADASKFKGSDYVQLLINEPETVDFDGTKVAVTDDLTTARRTYHIRRWAVEHSIIVRICGKDEAVVQQRRDAFLSALGRCTEDAAGYRIDIVVMASRWIQDRALLTGGTGYEVDVKFSDGIYIQRTVPLLKEMEITGIFEVNKNSTGK